MLARRIVLLPLMLLVFAFAGYEVWIHAGPRPLTAQAQSVSALPPVQIISSQGILPSFTYTDRRLGFSITYPSTFVRDAAAPPAWSYGADTKSGTAGLTLSLPSQAPYEREGGTAMIRIGIARDAASVADCIVPGNANIDEGTVAIGGVAFTKFSSPSNGVESYRALRNGACYAIETQVASKGGGAVSADAGHAQDALDAVAATFSFI